ncbi:S-layer homology domain-containing protein [Cohnella caldifontis]|uniref:S-layer homology domain-containing protein n=1 Tax=Cohnella caldifontis TaxID=3027471 RepID=UPI0023ED93B4|nr:S-layer homology domain-containing protein [Cohnella sp. YIM B05605]
MKHPHRLGTHPKRKLLVLPLAAALAASMPAAAFAESAVPSSSGPVSIPADKDGVAKEAPVNAAIAKSKAESLARGYVNVPDDYKLQNVNLYTQFDLANKRNVWSLSYAKSANGKTKGSINVSINADTGELLSYDAYVDNPNAKPAYPLKVDREAAKDVATAFIAKVSPNRKDQVRYDADFGADAKPPLNGQVRHHLRFNRVVGDIPFMENYIDVEVDSEGQIWRYSVQWNDSIEIKALKPALTEEEAAKKLRAAARLEPAYVVPYQMKPPARPVLVYNFDPVILDAVSGEPVARQDEWTPAASPLAEKPLAGKPETGRSLTREQAIEAVKKAFPIPDGASFSSANYNEYQGDGAAKGTASWDLSWQLKDGDKEIGSVYATVDSDTGVIRRYSQYVYRTADDRKDSGRISYADAKRKATDLMKERLPWLADQWYLTEPSADQIEEMEKNPDVSQYSFRFIRKAGEARVAADNASVDIDAVTGEVRNFWSDLSAYDYPAQTPELIGRDQALDAWMTAYRTELTYVTDMTFQYDGKPIPVEKFKVLIAAGEISADEVKANPTVKLVYRLVPKPADEPVMLDAQTGQWRNGETGEETLLVKPKATDIEGHWAQRELELMVAYRALDVADGKVRPNQGITRGELIKMLVLAINSGRPPIVYSSDATAKFADVTAESGYFPYVQNALEQNWIDVGDGSFHPEGQVDREEMAELIVRALGYNSLAEHDGLFNATFRDAADTKQRGQAAIAVGLGIMSLTDGKFQPARIVTRAEAASAFFRFLTVRAELQEAPLRAE